MHIAFDYTTGIYPGAGIARYTRSLISSLSHLDRENHYSLFYASRGLPRPTPETEQADALFASHPNFRPVPLPVSVRQMFALWQRLRLPIGVDRFTGRCDVMHSPDFVSPPHRTGADVITVHDLSFLVVPECAEPKLAAFLSRSVPAAVRRADHIIAVSHQTKKDLIRLLSVPPDKITVAHNGIDARFQKAEGRRQKAEVENGNPKSKIQNPKLSHLPDEFILHVGTLEPRKNLKRLVEAYGLLLAKSEIRNPKSEIALVLAGRKGWLYEPILEAAERVNSAGGRIIFVDYVYDSDLPVLYNMATVFAYPSLYEGFGLPAAEALACGVPTLVSTDGALSEVVGNAAIKVDPRSVEDIASGLEQLLSDDGLRATLSAKGPSQVAPFTWDAAARTVLDVYRRAAR
ncbi:MAG TPA: glycosyltransferase family 1 protein [Chloroflexia bacterium]|nr:glycosyltransferase family 1 protein [Chloroflexia bacterium]